MNETLFTISTLETFNPTYAMIQETAYANSSNNRKPQVSV